MNQGGFGTVTVGRGERQHPTPHPQHLLLHPFALGENPGEMVQKLLPLPRHHAKALTKHFFWVKKPWFWFKFPAWGRALRAPRSEAILAILRFFLGGGTKQPNPKLPLPFRPWSGPFWGESGTNTNFWLPTVPADPDLGFFCPSLALGGSSGGGRAGGAAKNTHETPPHTHTLSAQSVFGGKSGRIGQTAQRSRFSAGFGGIWGREVPACHVRGGVPALPPPPDAPNRPESPQIRRRRSGGVLPQI